MKRAKSLLAAIPILIGCLVTARAAGTQLGALAEPRNVRIDHDITVEGWRVQEIFLFLLRGTGLKGGFVESAACSEPPKGHLRLMHGVTVHDGMDALVAANPEYRWEWKGGVVDLLPRQNVPLLDTKVGKFEMVATDKELPLFFQDLIRLPVVKERESSLGLTQSMSGGGLFGGSEHPVAPKPVSIKISLHDLSLLEAFNEVVKAAPKGVWSYHQSNCDGSNSFVIQVTTEY